MFRKVLFALVFCLLALGTLAQTGGTYPLGSLTTKNTGVAPLNGYFAFPAFTTALLPTPSQAGVLVWNSDLGKFQQWDGSAWANLVPTVDTSGLVPYTGATGGVDLGAYQLKSAYWQTTGYATGSLPSPTSPAIAWDTTALAFKAWNGSSWSTFGVGAVPSGTGWRHVTAGVEDAATSTPTYTDVGALGASQQATDSAKLGGQLPAYYMAAVAPGTSGNVLTSNGSAWASSALPVFAGSTPGLVPTSAGGTVNFLRADGTFAQPPLTPPGGVSGQLQYNNAGAFGAVPGWSTDANGQVTATAQGATYTPLTINGAAGQTAPLVKTLSSDGLSGLALSPTVLSTVGANQGLVLSYSGTGGVAIGNATASGINAIAIGRANATASNSGAIAIGGQATAAGGYSLAMGDTSYTAGSRDMAIGYYATTGPSSSAGFALGNFTYVNAVNAMVIGNGVNNSNKLANSTASSIAMGTNSTIPTLFIGPSSGAGTIGKVGIGTTTLSAELTVNGDLTASGTVTGNFGNFQTSSTLFTSIIPVAGQPFMGISELGDLLYMADKRFTITATPAIDSASLFDGSYESSAHLAASTTQVININVAGQAGVPVAGITYPDGYLYVSFYYSDSAYSSISLRVKENGTWYSAATPVNVSTNPTVYKVLRFTMPAANYLTDIELTVVTDGTNPVWLTAINYLSSRYDSSLELPFVSKYALNNNLFGTFNIGSSTSPGALGVIGSETITAQNATSTPLTVNGAAGATAPLQTWGVAGTPWVTFLPWGAGYIKIGDGAGTTGAQVMAGSFYTTTSLGSGTVSAVYGALGINIRKEGVYSFSSTSAGNGTQDTSFSRASAGVLQVGDGTANANGTINAKAFNFGGTAFTMDANGQMTATAQGATYTPLTLVGATALTAPVLNVIGNGTSTYPVFTVSDPTYGAFIKVAYAYTSPNGYASLTVSDPSPGNANASIAINGSNSNFYGQVNGATRFTFGQGGGVGYLQWDYGQNWFRFKYGSTEISRFTGSYWQYAIPIVFGTTLGTPQTSISQSSAGVLQVGDGGANANGQIKAASASYTPQTKTGTYTIAATDGIVLCNGTFSVTLPAATGSGHVVRVKNTGTGTITVSRAGTDTIEGGTSVSLSTQYSWVALYDGASGVWYKF